MSVTAAGATKTRSSIFTGLQKCQLWLLKFWCSVEEKMELEIQWEEGELNESHTKFDLIQYSTRQIRRQAFQIHFLYFLHLPSLQLSVTSWLPIVELCSLEYLFYFRAGPNIYGTQLSSGIRSVVLLSPRTRSVPQVPFPLGEKRHNPKHCIETADSAPKGLVCT